MASAGGEDVRPALVLVLEQLLDVDHAKRKTAEQQIKALQVTEGKMDDPNELGIARVDALLQNSA